jgi:hypothetical protein
VWAAIQVGARPENAGKLIVAILASARQDIADQLCGCDRFMHASGLVAIGLGENCVQPLVMEVDFDGVYLQQDVSHRTVMQVQEAEGAPVGNYAFVVGYPQHLVHIQDVHINVDAVDAVGGPDREPGQVRLLDIFPYLDGLHFSETLLDPVFGSRLVPSALGHKASFLLISAARVANALYTPRHYI